MQTTAENSTFTVNLTIYVAVKVLCFSLAIAEFQTIAKKCYLFLTCYAESPMFVCIRTTRN